MKKFLKVIGITAIVAGIVYFVIDLIQFKIALDKKRDDLDETAKNQAKTKRESRQNRVKETLQNNIEVFEKKMIEYGAVMRDDFDADNREKFKLRPIYEYNGKFFRIGTIVFDEGDDPYIIVNAIDNEKYARLGVMEEIEAYPYDMTEERIEQVVKEYMETEL